MAVPPVADVDATIPVWRPSTCSPMAVVRVEALLSTTSRASAALSSSPTGPWPTALPYMIVV